MQLYVEVSIQTLQLFLRCHPPYFARQGLSLALELIKKTRRVGEYQISSCILLHGPEVTSVCWHTWIFVLKKRSWSQVLSLHSQRNCSRNKVQTSSPKIFLPLLHQFIYGVYTFICVHVCVHMSMWKSEDSFRELVLSDFHRVESAHHAKQKAFLSAKPSHWSFVFCFLLCLYVSLLSVLGVHARQFLCPEATSPATLFCCWFCFAASVLGD